MFRRNGDNDMSSKEKMKKLSSGTSLGWLDDANFVEDNSEMLEMTGRIALAIIKVMKKKGLTKKELANLKVSDVSEFKKPDLDNSELYSNSK